MIKATIGEQSRHVNLPILFSLLTEKSLKNRGWGSSVALVSTTVRNGKFLHPSYAHLSLATGESDVDESSGVLEALESSALGDLGLLLLLNLYIEMVSHRVVGVFGIFVIEGGEP